MRFDELRLRAWGPFTNLTLDLSEGSYGLHVVVGGNEAGKSSTLRAVSGLLFGVPKTCQDAFLHDNKVLRVGAVLRNRAGETLSVTRRKGTKNTLLDDAEQALPPSALAAQLGGLEENLFRSLFGIDHTALRSGGDELLETRGEQGQAIASASSGFKALKPVLDALESEAVSLFKPGRGKGPRINLALAELKEARDRITQATVKWSRYDEARKGITKLEAEREELGASLVAHHTSRNRLERVRSALPLIAQRRGLLAALSQLGEVTALPDDLSRNRMLLQQKRLRAQEDELAASAELQDLEATLQQLLVPSGLLEQAETVSLLLKASGSYTKASGDLTKLQALLSQNEDEARAILKDLGRAPSLDEVDAVRLPAPVRVKIQELSSKHEALQARLDAARQSVSEAEAERSQARAEKEKLGGVLEVAELRAALEKAQDAGDIDKARNSAELAVHAGEQAARADLNKLGLWEGSLEQVGSLPVAADDTIERFAAELSRVQGELRELAGQLQQAEAEGAGIEGKLQALQLAGAVPTEQELAAARGARDDAWQRLRGVWQGGAGYDAAGCDGYGARVQAADELADRLRRESGRVVEQANLLSSREANRALTAKRKELHAEAERAKTALEQQWAAAWAPAKIEPLPPAEMRTWKQKHAQLASKACELGKRRTELQGLQESSAALRAGLVEALGGLGDVQVPASAELAPVLRRARAVVERVDAVERERARLDSLIRERELRCVRAGAEVERAEAALQDWQHKWLEAVKEVGLTQGTSPAEASAVVDRIQELLRKVDEAAGHRRRIQGIERDARAFEGDVSQLAGRVAPSLAGMPAAQAISSLDARVKEALKGEARRAELEKTRLDKVSVVTASRSVIKQCDGELAELCRLAKCAAVDDLPEAERRWSEASRVRQELARLELQLQPLAAGAGLEGFVEEAERQDADALPAQLQEEEGRIRELEGRREQLEQDIGARKAELDRFMGGSEAAEAAESAQSLAARLREHTERYLRVRLASALLRSELEAYRREHQGPLMKRASELFCLLTAGSFASLRLGYGDKDELLLLGVRPSDQEVGVEAMSDGTRDQLYLALRLAGIERYVERNEPVPFIVDDIFVHYDDRRAAAALEVLGELSRKLQVIIFTHHAHLLQVARSARCGEMLIEHVLG